MRPHFLPLTFALAIALPAAAGAADQAPRRIMVVGEGQNTVAPDMAILSLSVMREAPSARDALTANNDAMAAVISAMKAAGIEERDLQTAGVQIAPRYNFATRTDGSQEAQLVAYQVTNTLSVRVRDLAKTGDILDKSVTLGVNEGGGISFTNEDPSKAITEARKKAVADAIARAKTLAEAAGVKLGKVLEMSDLPVQQPPVPMMARFPAQAASAAVVPIQGGENAYHVQVNVTFELN
jgi:uncharacterized protein YggE